MRFRKFFASIVRVSFKIFFRKSTAEKYDLEMFFRKIMLDYVLKFDIQAFDPMIVFIKKLIITFYEKEVKQEETTCQLITIDSISTY